jgi:hypothetical protein
MEMIQESTVFHMQMKIEIPLIHMISIYRLIERF